MEDKQRLRTRLRRDRRAHVAALADNMRGLIMLRPPGPVASRVPEGNVVGLYHATQFEAPTAGYARWFYENGRRLALPWFAERGAAMMFRAWLDPFDLSDLEPGPWGALQPGTGAEELLPDLTFVPLIGFTAEGQRLGQGGGHYDRWLGDHPDTLAIGLAWDIQLCASLPVEPHDRKLAAIVTPTRIYEDHER